MKETRKMEEIAKEEIRIEPLNTVLQTEEPYQITELEECLAFGQMNACDLLG